MALEVTEAHAQRFGRFAPGEQEGMLHPDALPRPHGRTLGT